MYLTEAELNVLNVLWTHGGCKIQRIVEILYPDQSVSDFATISTLLRRLKAKGCVGCDRSGPRLVHLDSVSREEVAVALAETQADMFCKGSVATLLTELIAHSKLSATELDDLRSALDNNGKAKVKARRTG